MKRDYGVHLVSSGVLFTVVLQLWPIFMAAAQPEGGDAELLQWLVEHANLSKIQFGFAFLIGPAIVYMMSAQLHALGRDESLGRTVGFVFLAGYLALISIAYGSQVVLVPRLLDAGLLEHARVWTMGSSVSAIYFVNQLGYLFWAAGAIALFAPHLATKGPIRYLSALYLLSAVLSIVAFAGLMLESSTLNSLTVVGGLVLVPTGFLTVGWGMSKWSGVAREPQVGAG